MGAKLKKLTEKLSAVKTRFNKKTQFAVAIILSLVMLIIFVDALKKPTSEKAENKKNVEESRSSGDYVSNLETRLEKMLSSLNGVNDTKVFIMTETSVKTIYAVDEKLEESGEESKKNKTSASTEIVFSKEGSTSSPIVSVEVYPEIVGVLIVADTKKDEKTRLMILNAVSVALNVSNSKIEVLLTEDV